MGQTLRYTQSNFSGGELGPRMYARSDDDLYYKSLKKARDVIGTPQGGLIRRFGLDYVDSLNINSFSEIRMEEFIISEEDEFAIIFTPNLISIYKDKSLVASVTTNYTSDIILEIRVAQQLSTMIIAHGSMNPQQLVKGANDSDWTLSDVVFSNLPVFSFDTGYLNIETYTLSAETGQNITITASSSIFTTENIDGTFEAVPGIAKITGFISATQVTASVITPFSKTDYSGSEIILTVPAFSAKRGWPKSVGFYQQRLAFGGTNELKNALFYSVINDFFNFLIGLAQPSEAILFLIAGVEDNIDFMLNAFSMFIFTPGGTYATPPLTDEAFDASTARINCITNIGIKKNVEPIFADSQIFFLDKSGSNLNAVNYNIQSGGYKVTGQAYTIKDILFDAIDITKIENDPFTQGTYIYIANGDGNLITYQTIDNENVKTWTIQETDGDFGKAQGVGNNLYFVIKRVVDNQDVYYLEKANYNSYFDSAIFSTFATPTNIVSGLEHLDKKTVSVRCDGVFVGDDFVVQNGQIILPNNCTNVEVGLKYTPEIVLLPVNIQTQTGDSLYMQRSIRTVTLNVFETYGISLNGEEVPGYSLGTYQLGSAPSLFTGFVQIPYGISLDANQEVRITQDVPYNLNLIGIELELELGG